MVSVNLPVTVFFIVEDAEVKVPLVENTELIVLPFDPGVGQCIAIHATLAPRHFFLAAPEGRPGMSDVSPLSGISGLSFDSTFLSPLLFFCLVLLPFLSYRFLPAGPFF